MSDITTTTENGWRRFWNKGAWWKALILVIIYDVLYQVIPVLWGSVAESATKDGPFASPLSALFTFGMPVIVGSVLLLAFSWSVGWLPKPLFTKQPVRGRWWMWIAVVLVLLPIVIRLIGTDYSAYSVGTIIMILACGLFIGLSEELLTRGLVVEIMRRAGHNEWLVAFVSALFFALLHSGNIFSGQSLQLVGSTIGYTFAFGVLMYLTMRVTGSIVWAIVLHGLTDPTNFLATGGIDAERPHTNQILSLAAPATILLIIGACVLLIFIRGRAYPELARKKAEAAPAAS
ncbi:CPBP family intramembrane glutamic endopeptidase [Microbacterium sp. NPDC057650]|uniref:CPBP family intramembrane glutamic endopeptidase n=1 Tax=unclassified Microbacterium TaxID=2609290 RepID=UPI00366BA8AF